ncbi:MAG: hypothetical protein LBG99_08505 [Propionibacteriaceae bacterium]|jgi:hypothetical protein|nr:hypothetical protein [Propionibacteriaceae bacterium]
MKKAKYFTSAILMFSALVLIGEFYVWHISSFETDYAYTTFSVKESAPNSQLIADVLDAAHQTDIEFFLVARDVESIFSITMNIFSTDGAKDVLTNKGHIRSGTLSSIFIGDVTVRFFSVEEWPTDRTPDVLYLIGDMDDQISFKQILIDSYGGRYPQQPMRSLGDAYNVLGVWFAVFGLLLLMSTYEAALMKREVLVRVTSGQSLSVFIASNILRDLVFYSVTITAMILLLSEFTNASYMVHLTGLSVAVFLVSNSLQYMRLLRFDFRKDVNTRQGAKRILWLSFIYKVVVILFAIIIMSGNVKFIADGADYYRQKPFFEQHADFNYVNISAEANSDFSISKSIMFFFAAQKQTMTIVDLESWNTAAEYVYSDASALPYLQSVIPELEGTILDRKVYFLVPRTYFGLDNIESDMMDIWWSYYDQEYDFEIVECRTTDVIAISNQGVVFTSIKRNPIIILNNLGPSSIEHLRNPGYISASTLFNISSADFEEFVSEAEVATELHYLTNAYANYQYHLKLVDRSIMIGLVMLFLVVGISSMVTRSLLLFDYTINATERSLMRLHGYTVARINLRTFALLVITTLLAVVVSINLAPLAGIRSVAYLGVGGGVLLLLDLSVTLHYMRKYSRISFQRVSKGATL